MLLPQLELWHFSQFESLHGHLLYPVPFLTALFKPFLQKTTFSICLSLIPHNLPSWVLKSPSQLFMLSLPIVAHHSGWISSDSVQALISRLCKDVFLILLRLCCPCCVRMSSSLYLDSDISTMWGWILGLGLPVTGNSFARSLSSDTPNTAALLCKHYSYCGGQTFQLAPWSMPPCVYVLIWSPLFEGGWDLWLASN